jgi:hypothetical protein
MKYFKDNLTWLVPTVIVTASGYMVAFAFLYGSCLAFDIPSSFLYLSPSILFTAIIYLVIILVISLIISLTNLMQYIARTPKYLHIGFFFSGGLMAASLFLILAYGSIWELWILAVVAGVIASLLSFILSDKALNIKNIKWKWEKRGPG